MQRMRPPKMFCGGALMLPVTTVLALVVFGVYVLSASSSNEEAVGAATGFVERAIDEQPRQPDDDDVGRGVAEGIPLQITHQGVIKVSDLRFTGDGYFKFALADDTNTNVWTHDGTHVGQSVEPDGLVTVNVQKGIYSVALGGPGMGPIDPSVFTEHDELYLRIWFTDGVSSAFALPLDPPLKMTSTSYAYQAFSAGDGVPPGGIIMWSGAVDSIPAGWQLCDGTNGTPDLVDRFVLSVSAGENPGTTGGSHYVTLTSSCLPAHTHSFTTDPSGEHQHSYRRPWPSLDMNGPIPGSGVEDIVDSSTGSAGEHTHTGTTDTTGDGEPFDNRPAYYTLAFIMKL
ncbi:MAG: hypothetical protein KAV82_05730 [Phycisphaerae bacterium]|nr:hypothetical protein [Phycisphaerae bacterium]